MPQFLTKLVIVTYPFALDIPYPYSGYYMNEILISTLRNILPLAVNKRIKTQPWDASIHISNTVGMNGAGSAKVSWLSVRPGKSSIRLTTNSPFFDWPVLEVDQFECFAVSFWNLLLSTIHRNHQEEIIDDLEVYPLSSLLDLMQNSLHPKHAKLYEC